MGTSSISLVFIPGWRHCSSEWIPLLQNSHYHPFNPCSWLTTGSWAFSPPLAQGPWPCYSSSCLWLLLPLSPPTKGQLKEPTAPAVRRRLALEWKCGAGCRPRPWKDSSKNLLLLWERKRTRWASTLLLPEGQFYITRATNLQLGPHWDCGEDFPSRLIDLHGGLPCITVCLCEPFTEMCLCVMDDNLRISKTSSRQKTVF